MRMRKSRVQTYHHRKKISKKDAEGSSYVEYESATEFQGEMWPAGGNIQAEMYGNRLPYIRNVRINEKYEITVDEKGIVHYICENGMDIVEDDGICLYASSDSLPDYKIISIKPYRFLQMEVEKL